MLRSKNLKKILEQALTRDVCVCALFNEDGVVLAHASSPSSIVSAGGRRDGSWLATHAGSGLSGDYDRHHQSPSSSQQQHFNYEGDSHGSDYGRDMRMQLGREQSAAVSGPLHVGGSGGKYKGGIAESSQRRQPTAAASTGVMPLQTSHQSLSQNYGAVGDGPRQHSAIPITEPASYSSSLNDGLIEGSPGAIAREKLEDDLAIAANLWQSFESIPGLIERKDTDMDDYTGDGASEMQDDMQGNSLNMIIIECENGKAAVTRLGSYRLFMLTKPNTPLGLLKHKSNNLCRYLEECLHYNSP
ncbi:hypothetical protein LPJ66_001883 [Kickxella alabastrina]|uniref:Uncharacterized protein n=1 Tax=Kickxella alabastrina TaxID=61397 RepID=A0ACC1IRZ7_9FUNG|nr:hypothetical protein LPJ66_001883 [Kickxella alabastrina]